MKYRIVVHMAALTGCLICAAHAQNLTDSSPGFHYFYKAGAAMEQHDADLIECAVTLRAMVNGSDAMTGIAAASGGGFLPALIGGIIDNNENRQGAAANAENCMALRGWSVVGLTEEEGKRIEAFGDAPAIHAELAHLVDAPEPLGVILRTPYANELANGIFSVGAAGDLEEVSLSRRAVRPMVDAAIEAAGDLKPPKPPKLPKGVKAPKAVKTLKADALPIADPANAQIVLSMIAQRTQLNMNGLTLHRLTYDGEEIVYDGAPINAQMGGNLSPKVKKTKLVEERRYDFVAEVPPGLWKIATIYNGAFGADLCFGAPAFTVGEGETIFLGVMRIPETGGYPLDTDRLDIAHDILSPAPALAERVKPAVFTNGYTSDCFGSYAYAYEIEKPPVFDANGEPVEEMSAAEPQPQDQSSE